MARIIYTLGELKGSIAGATFQQNASGKIVRSRPRVKRSSTTKQQTQHEFHQQLLAGWQGLTNVQRNDWNTYASIHDKINKFGESKTLTGANWYESVNYWQLKFNFVLFTSPPPHNLPQAVPAFTINITDNTIGVTVTGAMDWATNGIIWWATYPSQRNKPTVNNIRRWLEQTFIDPGGDIDFTGVWNIRMGFAWLPLQNFPSSNVYICAETYRRDSGITSPMLCNKISTSTVAFLDTDSGLDIQTDDGDDILID
jgi:hypothetical protein